MIKVSEHIDHLITRVLSGEASSQEKLQLEQWLNESEANRKYFDQIKFIHEKASRTYLDIDFNVDNAWSNVKSQMKYTPKIDIKTHKTQWRWISAAASIVAIIGISTIIYFSTQEKIKTSTTATTTTIDTTIDTTYKLPKNAIAIASKDSSINQKLPDNTQICLNKKSKVTYAPDYGKKDREVTLVGEAYFNATHSKDKPLIVKTDGTFIKDLGTSFNIMAYPEEDIIEVYVESGKVIFYSERDSGLTLVKGDVGVYNKKENSFTKRKIVDANILSYKTKSFTFINAKLSDVIRQLNRVYSAQISLNNNEIGDSTITVTFENESIETIATILSETLDLKISKTSEGYTLDNIKSDNP